MLSVNARFTAQYSNVSNGFALGSELKANQSQSRCAGHSRPENDRAELSAQRATFGKHARRDQGKPEFLVPSFGTFG
jgi:hypothetical protein